MRAIWPAVAVTAAALAVGAVGAGAQGEVTIAPGFDLFETDPAVTVFRFQGQNRIPANFFDQGSQQFQGDVNFGGVPIERFQNKDVGNADTIVRRSAAATVPANGSSEPVPIELVQLSLHSVAPIQVSVNQQTQLWNVRAEASPVRPSRGEMVLRGNATGGEFDSALQVYPKFTFTRLSDGATRVLDVGALPDNQRPDQPLRANATPWRSGCVRPAPGAKGLNDGFCAGQTPARETPVVVEQGPHAQHGVRTASEMLEHFKCYSAPPAEGSNFNSRPATLTDQFGTGVVKVERPARLCAPVRKNKERFRNKKAHLECYTHTAQAPGGPPRVALMNQFGTFEAEVRRPEFLCLPSTKQLVGQKKPSGVVPTDHFQCYVIKASGTFPNPTLRLEDQFLTVKVKLPQPTRLCVPTQKDDVKVRHPVQHLVCYRIPLGPPVNKTATVRNQYGRLKLRVERARELCVPTVKLRTDSNQ